MNRLGASVLSGAMLGFGGVGLNVSPRPFVRGEVNHLPLASEPLTKRQRRRLRGKAKQQRVEAEHG